MRRLSRIWTLGHLLQWPGPMEGRFRYSNTSMASQTGIPDHIGVAECQGRDQGNEYRGKLLDPEHPKHQAQADEAQGSPQVSRRPRWQSGPKGTDEGKDRRQGGGPQSVELRARRRALG